jgi:hypothetical protein
MGNCGNHESIGNLENLKTIKTYTFVEFLSFILGLVWKVCEQSIRIEWQQFSSCTTSPTESIHMKPELHNIPKSNGINSPETRNSFQPTGRPYIGTPFEMKKSEPCWHPLLDPLLLFHGGTFPLNVSNNGVFAVNGSFLSAGLSSCQMV